MDTVSISARRYSVGAMVFHWLIAILIMLNFLGAWVAEDMPKTEAMQVMGNHKAIGITVLIMSIARILWRLAHRLQQPPLLESLKAWEAALAKVVHTLFYFLMVAIPLSGWAMHSVESGGKPVGVFGLFSYPSLPLAHDKAMGEIFEDTHGMLTTLMLALLLLHVVGAIKHMVIDRDGTMRRMLPWGK